MISYDFHPSGKSKAFTASANDNPPQSLKLPVTGKTNVFIFSNFNNSPPQEVLIRTKTPLLNASNLLGAMANASTSLGCSREAKWLHTYLARIGKTQWLQLATHFLGGGQNETGNYNMRSARVNNLGDCLTSCRQDFQGLPGLSRTVSAICSVEGEIVQQFTHPTHHRHRAKL